MADEARKEPYGVLFLCTGNSARSIIAEAILNEVGKGKFRGYSAGTKPSGVVNPHAIALLVSLGFDVGRACSKSWDEFCDADGPAIHFVITLCDNVASETCPVWPGQTISAHWGVPNPAAVKGTPEEMTRAFREVFKLLENRIALFADLPVENLDPAALQRCLDEIGASENA